MADDSAPPIDEHPPLPPTPDNRLLIILGATVLIAGLPVLALGLRPGASTTVEIGSGFTDNFDRQSLGDNYWTMGDFWRIADNQLFSPGAHNNPLWLRAALTADVTVDFDARSESPEGGAIKCEIFGNGYDHASGYILVFGDRVVTAIGRLDEYGAPADSQLPEPIPNGGHVRVQRQDLRVEQSKTYHWTVTRKGMTLTWMIDGVLILQLIDPEPLRGSGHDRFAFSTWDADVYYDNLKITPL
jgi:hypothetical protein